MIEWSFDLIIERIINVIDLLNESKKQFQIN